MSILAKLQPARGAIKKRKRVGRGEASGHGRTSTRGNKGQKSRSSRHIRPGFEGGQMPLHRRSPKWGFTRAHKIYFQIVNLEMLNEKFKEGDEVTPSSCLEKRLIRKAHHPMKVLGQGTLTKPLKVSAHAFSKVAEDAIKKNQGTVTVLKKAASY